VTPEACPTPSVRNLLNPFTGEWYDEPCRTLGCPPCARSLAWATAGAINLARPDNLLLLTGTGPTWKSTHQRMARFNARMRAAVGPDAWQLAYVVHPPTTGRQCHIHGYHRGPLVDPSTLHEAASHAGMGATATITALRHQSAAYAFHHISETRGMSDERARPHIQEFCEVNGGTYVVHVTRGFWRDDRGRSTTLRNARLIAKRLHRANRSTRLSKAGVTDMSQGLLPVAALVEERS
jgi:hypothetical protein